MTILSVLHQIKIGQIVLPAIQRNFVWSAEQVLCLLESILQGYPIGLALLWETYLDIEYRSFVSDFRPDEAYSFKDNRQRKKLRLVLDGQQRLQTLYMALFGTYHGKSLYLDILSGTASPGSGGRKYGLAFLTPDELQPWPPPVPCCARGPFEAGEKPRCFLRVPDLFACGAKEKSLLKKRVASDLSLSAADQERMDINLSFFDEALSKNTNLLQVSVIDEDLPPESDDRKSEAEVLEIFMRTNSVGAPLSRSDLIFSMLKLHWKGSAESLPEFLRGVNEGNSFHLDADFVIRCLSAVSGSGTRLDLALLGTAANIERLRASFPACCDAIRSTVDAVTRDCGCASSRLLGGASTLAPFVYYLFHTARHEIPNGQLANFRKALYLFGFARLFARHSESRLQKFIQQELAPLASQPDAGFPVSAAAWWVDHWEGCHGVAETLLLRNPALTLHVVQNLNGSELRYRRNAEELDHIFPRSELRKRGYDEAEIHHFANLWILPKGKNQNKGNQDPAEYLREMDPFELELALIDRALLDYSSFRTFLKRRTLHIVETVKDRLQFTDHESRSARGAERKRPGGIVLSLRQANITSEFLNAMPAKQSG